MASRPRGAGRRPTYLLGIALVALLLLTALPMGARASAHSPSNLPTTSGRAPIGSLALGASHPPPLGFGSAALGPRPSASVEFYTQTGATLSQVNGSSSSVIGPSLSENVTLVPSPYPIAYELNVLSAAGDWFQITVADNWPGCNPGFEELTEIWTASGSAGPPTCDATVALSKGNVVTMTVAFASGGKICLTLLDLNSSHSSQSCTVPPDSGSLAFVLLSQASSGPGYYTGTMTEILNTTISACPSYYVMPTVTFDFPSWEQVTEYVPWADEFEIGGSGIICYDHAGSAVQLTASNPQSHTVNPIAGTAYPARYVMGQLDQAIDPSVGFRAQSDPTPAGHETLTAAPLDPYLGESVNLTAAMTGGSGPPDRTLWALNGLFLGVTVSPYRSFSSTVPGNDSFVAWGIDGQGDASAPSTPATIVEPFPLQVGSVLASTGAGADVGQPIDFSASVTGGYRWVTLWWTGLPLGCFSSNSSTLACTPTSFGSSLVVLHGEDANASFANSSGLAFVVDPAMRVSIGGSLGLGDVGQGIAFVANVSGGAGPVSYTWAGLPGGCTPMGSNAVCDLSTPGTSSITLEVIDANGAVSTSPAVDFTTYEPPTVTFTASRAVVDLGGSLTLTPDVLGGAGATISSWSGLPVGCEGALSGPFDCQPSELGTYTIGLSIVDRASAVAVAGTLVLSVVSDPSLSLKAQVGSDRSIDIQPTLSGGSAIALANWSGLPMGCPLSHGLAPLGCIDPSAGNYTVSLAIVDIGGGSANASVSFTVPVAPPTPPMSPVGLLSALLIPALLVGLLIVGAAVAIGRSRRLR